MANYNYTSLLAGVSADVATTALALAQRQSDSGTNFGISDNLNPALGVIGQGGANDPLGKGTAYLQAQSDVLLGTVGFQKQDDTAPNTTTTSASFVILRQFSWTVPIAKTYLIMVDIIWWNSTAAAVGNLALNVGGTGSVGSAVSGGTPLPQPNTARLYFGSGAVIPIPQSFRQSYAFPSATAQNINVLWKTSAGTLNCGANEGCTITILG